MIVRPAFFSTRHNSQLVTRHISPTPINTANTIIHQSLRRKQFLVVRRLRSKPLQPRNLELNRFSLILFLNISLVQNFRWLENAVARILMIVRAFRGDDGIKHLKNCEKLVLSFCDQITDDGL